MDNIKQKNPIIISYWQIFLLTIAQGGGATILNLPGVIEAGRNIWLSNILASFIGYLAIYLHYKPLSVSKIISMPMVLTKYWGRFIGGIVCLYYFYYLFILCNLVLSDVFYFGKITMPETPGYIFAIFLMAPAIYAVKLGLEAMSRFLEFLIPPLIGLYIFLFILVIPKLNFSNLLPIASDGILPILRGAIFNMSFPFADFLPIVFFYQYIKDDINKDRKFIKSTFSAVFLITVMLTFRAITSVAAFEEATLKSLTFPPFNTIRIIEVGDVLERLDAIFIAIFYGTTFFKFTLTYYVACKIVSDYFNAVEVKIFSTPIAVLIGLSMPFLMPSFNIILRTSITYFFITLPLLFILPLLLYVTINVKGNIKG
ncbi:GerAB/ArcD/ProY family transporter [Alkaliphilus serpentinus]|uniref:GerAB/ArcD/ProY family transporter n=1 Tax=Alkaliphilus serpentinus TaxID=1482731 RepID=A0A833MEE9_9FIRM|nr:GerAB/ArcD/ProY family transporter [Alkaliphilus serpentinus]KAB3531090.1 GerAB/ArcD/ProY family transporter [Alkaliphilus serpentinus]